MEYNELKMINVFYDILLSLAEHEKQQHDKQRHQTT